MVGLSMPSHEGPDDADQVTGQNYLTTLTHLCGRLWQFWNLVSVLVLWFGEKSLQGQSPEYLHSRFCVPPSQGYTVRSPGSTRPWSWGHGSGLTPHSEVSNQRSVSQTSQQNFRRRKYPPRGLFLGTPFPSGNKSPNVFPQSGGLVPTSGFWKREPETADADPDSCFSKRQ